MCRLYWMVWKVEFHCQTLLNNFVVKMQTFQIFTLLELTLLVYLQHWFRIKKLKPNREEAGFRSKLEQQKLLALHKKWFCLWVCAQFSENQQPTISNVRQILLSEIVLTMLTLATRKFKRMRAFDGFGK